MAADARDRTLALFRRIDGELVAWQPGKSSGLTPGQFISVGLFLTCWTNFGGVAHLVKQELAEPGMIICRSLVLDAIRLAYFAERKGELEKLAVRFTKLSLAEERGFLERAKAGGLTIDDRLERLDEQDAELRARADSLGMTKIPGLPKETEMAKEVASFVPRLHVAAHSQVVHTNRIAIARRLRQDGEGGFDVKLTSDEPELLMVSDQAIAAMCNAWLSVSVLLNLSDEIVTSVAHSRDQIFAEWRQIWRDAGLDDNTK